MTIRSRLRNKELTGRPRDAMTLAPPNYRTPDNMSQPSPVHARSPFFQFLGMEIVERTEGRAIIELDIRREFLNISGIPHGGVLASLIDSACGVAATWVPDGVPERRVMTLSLTTSYIAPARGPRIRAAARVRGGGRKTVICDAEVFDADGTLLATGLGNFRYRGDTAE
jgi:uncharacterized protein (TIGR00369 family)